MTAKKLEYLYNQASKLASMSWKLWEEIGEAREVENRKRRNTVSFIDEAVRVLRDEPNGLPLNVLIEEVQRERPAKYSTIASALHREKNRGGRVKTTQRGYWGLA